MAGMIGILGPSSVVPKIELKLGIDKLKTAGFSTKTHPNTLKSYRFFAGTDGERAQSIFDFAVDPECDVIWCARGGYGSGRLLPLLDQLALKHGDPRPGKLLIGYSDAAALFEYVRKEWGWSALHAPMPAIRSFSHLKKEEWNSLTSLVNRENPKNLWGKARLRYVGGGSISSDIVSELIGGNLTVLASIVGSKYFGETSGKILFFEDIAEYPYRIDRAVTQLDLAGAFEGVRAVVLGDFLNCTDHVTDVLAEAPKSAKSKLKFKPIRKKINEKKLIPEIFAEIGTRHGFPVFSGLPVGHGPGHFSLPIGGRYRLSSSGVLSLESWQWLR